MFAYCILGIGHRTDDAIGITTTNLVILILFYLIIFKDLFISFYMYEYFAGVYGCAPMFLQCLKRPEEGH